MKRSVRSSIGGTCLCLIAIIAITGSARAESQVVATGKLEGRGGHKMSGGATLLKADSGYIVVLESDFKFDGAPAPRVAFGKGGYEPNTKFSKLKSNSGIQAYSVPDSIDPKQFTELWIWCEKFDVPLGVANLNTATQAN